MLKFNLKIEHWVIVILLAILLLDNCKGDTGEFEVENSVKITEKVITKKDSSSNNNIKNRAPEKVHFIETSEKVEIVTDPEKLTPLERGQVKEANQYIDTTKISDGYVISNILSEGRILRLDLKTSIDHLQRTIETTKKTTKQASGLFINPTTEYVPVTGFTSMGLGLTYIQGDLGIGIGGFFDFNNNQLGIRFSLYRKLL